MPESSLGFWSLKFGVWCTLDKCSVCPERHLQPAFYFFNQGVSKFPGLTSMHSGGQAVLGFDIPASPFWVVGMTSPHHQAQLYLKVLNSNNSCTTDEGISANKDYDCLVMSKVFSCVNTARMSAQNKVQSLNAGQRRVNRRASVQDTAALSFFRQQAESGDWTLQGIPSVSEMTETRHSVSEKNWNSAFISISLA